MPEDPLFARFIAQIRPKRPNLGGPTTAMFEALRDAARASVGVELLRFVYAGSLAKGTGLRRYRDRDCDIPGQMVDLVVELAPGEPPSFELFEGLEGVAQACFVAAGQAAELDFRRDRLAWRLLPIFAQRGPEGYVQWRLTPGRAVHTNVRTHALEVRRRTRSSVEASPRVAFNDGVRLLAWWHAARPSGADGLGRFALERLAALAFDRVGVHEDFATTLASWADALAQVDAGDLRDPANEAALLLPDWTERDQAALARWLDEGAQMLRRADPDELAERMFGAAFTRP